MVSRKILPRMGLWSLALVGIIVEARPLGIASDCSAGLRNASQRQQHGVGIITSLGSSQRHFMGITFDSSPLPILPFSRLSLSVSPARALTTLLLTTSLLPVFPSFRQGVDRTKNICTI